MRPDWYLHIGDGGSGPQPIARCQSVTDGYLLARCSDAHAPTSGVWRSQSNARLPIQVGRLMRWTFDAWLPGLDASNASDVCLIAQWQAVPDAGDIARPPPLALIVRGGEMVVTVRSDSAPNTAQRPEPVDIARVPVLPGWQSWAFDIVFHPVHGHVRVTRDGEVIGSHCGGVGYNDAVTPYLAMGYYRWDAWPADARERVVVFRDIDVQP